MNSVIGSTPIWRALAFCLQSQACDAAETASRPKPQTCGLARAASSMTWRTIFALAPQHGRLRRSRKSSMPCVVVSPIAFCKMRVASKRQSNCHHNSHHTASAFSRLREIYSKCDCVTASIFSPSLSLRIALLFSLFYPHVSAGVSVSLANQFHQSGRAVSYLACLISRSFAEIMLSTC